MYRQTQKFTSSTKKDAKPSINRRIRREVDKFTSEIQDDLRQLSKALSLSVRPTRWA